MSEDAARDVFHALVRGVALVQEGGHALQEGSAESAPRDPPSLWLEVCRHDFLGEAAPFDGEWLAFHAPLGLTEGAWLQQVACVGDGHGAAAAKLFGGYLALLGRNEAESPAACYRALLARAGCGLPPVTSRQFAFDSRVGVPALRFASVRLQLGLRAARAFPEIIGFTLAFAGSASPWRLAGMEPARRQAVLRRLACHARDAMELFLGESGGARWTERWRRLVAGYSLYSRSEAEYTAALAACTSPTPDQQAGAIFRRKAGFARGYHAAIHLGGRPLDDWFAAQPFDAAGFLAALAASPYVEGEAGQRPFDRLTAFGGPMFGIFSGEELETIDAWLRSANKPVRPVPAVESAVVSDPSTRTAALQAIAFGRRRLPVRTLFHGLVNDDPSPQVLGAAADLVARVLRRAERRVRTWGPLRERFFAYSPEGLAERVRLIHDKERARYRSFDGKPRLQSEEYLFGMRQFAPAILVDGCWLRHACCAAQQDDRLHRLLLKIYADELGAGEAERHHALVYRALLRQAGIELPDVSDAAFAADDGFLDAAFDLPVYLLAISLFSDRRLPELLGLNLAIELSGLGAQYLTLADELAYWGFDPLIVRLHQSIDSLAGGHAALAVETIQIHLERVQALGSDDVTRHWRRVWCGYLSLQVAAGRFKRALVLAFCQRFLPGRTRRLLCSISGSTPPAYPSTKDP